MTLAVILIKDILIKYNILYNNNSIKYKDLDSIYIKYNILN
jgi:hypothetical protein